MTTLEKISVLHCRSDFKNLCQMECGKTGVITSVLERLGIVKTCPELERDERLANLG